MDANKSPRKYNTNKRRKIMEKISQIKNKDIFVEIYKIINKDIGNKFSENKNGIFFNINKLKDSSIEKILNLITNYTESITASETDTKISYIPLDIDPITSIESVGPRLNNQEKNILKRIRKNK